MIDFAKGGNLLVFSLHKVRTSKDLHLYKSEHVCSNTNIDAQTCRLDSFSV